jgi:L-ascorbate metabolism protein UlaG (beta-lactamase superfamily)
MNIEFTWVGGATWILEIQGLKIACDPVLCPMGTVQDYFWFKTERLEEPVFTDADFGDIDLWLITHGHEDHLDDIGLSRIGQGAHVVTHENAMEKLRKTSPRGITVLNWRETKSFSIRDMDVTIEAMPAVHGVNPISAFFAGRVNGYWINIVKDRESKSVYVTSDTVTHKKVLEALKGRKVDLLVPNMGAAKRGSWLGTLTLSAAMLNRIQAIVKPELTVPVHFGTFEHYVEPISKIGEPATGILEILAPGETYEGTL